MGSPYLKAGRLSDVIAAITTLGSYKFYKLDAAGLADRISGRQKSAEHWVSVFREHPEFFRQASENERYSLVWRRQFPRNFDVDAEKEMNPDHQLTGEAYDRISRRPLEPSELTAFAGGWINGAVISSTSGDRVATQAASPQTAAQSSQSEVK